MSLGEKSKVIFMAFPNEVQKKRLNQTSHLRGRCLWLVLQGSWFESRLEHYLERVFVSSSKKHSGYCLN